MLLHKPLFPRVRRIRRTSAQAFVSVFSLPLLPLFFRTETPSENKGNKKAVFWVQKLSRTSSHAKKMRTPLVPLVPLVPLPFAPFVFSYGKIALRRFFRTKKQRKQEVQEVQEVQKEERCPPPFTFALRRRRERYAKARAKTPCSLSYTP
jgi:hypothetical protein